MALIKCKECGKEYSDMALACPNCACPTEVSINSIKVDEDSGNVETNNGSNERICPKCGNSIPEDETDCAFCRDVEIQIKKNKAKKKRVVIALLCLGIFLLGVFVIKPLFESLLSGDEKDEWEEVRELAQREAMIRGYHFNGVNNSYPGTITSIKERDGRYTVYGLIRVSDNYGDKYSGKFTAIYEGTKLISFDEPSSLQKEK